MFLSDRTIREMIDGGRIIIEPFSPDDVQPASVDLHLTGEILAFANSGVPYIDLRGDIPDLMEPVNVPEGGPFILHPGEFVLGGTIERLAIPNDIVAHIEGKSSLGRIGLMIHSTAGFVDPGWDGRLTLELINVSRLPLTLYKGMRICQVSFQKLTTPADRPYGSKGLNSRYQGQKNPTPSRAHLDFDDHLKHK